MGAGRDDVRPRLPNRQVERAVDVDEETARPRIPDESHVVPGVVPQVRAALRVDLTGVPIHPHNAGLQLVVEVQRGVVVPEQDADPFAETKPFSTLDRHPDPHLHRVTDAAEGQGDG